MWWFFPLLSPPPLRPTDSNTMRREHWKICCGCCLLRLHTACVGGYWKSSRVSLLAHSLARWRWLPLVVVGSSFVVRILFTKITFGVYVELPVYLLHTFSFSSPPRLSFIVFFFIFLRFSSSSYIFFFFFRFLWYNFHRLFISDDEKENSLDSVCSAAVPVKKKSSEQKKYLKSHTDESNTNYKLGQC